MFVLRKTDNPRRGFFVAPSGSKSSYVRLANKARHYESRAEAEKDRCGNEVIIHLAEALK